MSRIGKQILPIPNGVEVTVDESFITVKGPKGQLQESSNPQVQVIVEEGSVKFAIADEEDKTLRAMWGLYASLVNNMLEGVTNGFTKKLEVNGVGYKVALSGKTLTLSLGFSHDVKYELAEGVTAEIEKNLITISGISKQKVGQVAAEIRSFRKPEPYKGKGIKYIDEIVRRKVGKAAAKA